MIYLNVAPLAPDALPEPAPPFTSDPSRHSLASRRTHRTRTFPQIKKSRDSLTNGTPFIIIAHGILHFRRFCHYEDKGTTRISFVARNTRSALRHVYAIGNSGKVGEKWKIIMRIFARFVNSIHDSGSVELLCADRRKNVSAHKSSTFINFAISVTSRIESTNRSYKY